MSEQQHQQADSRILSLHARLPPSGDSGGGDTDSTDGDDPTAATIDRTTDDTSGLRSKTPGPDTEDDRQRLAQDVLGGHITDEEYLRRASAAGNGRRKKRCRRRTFGWFVLFSVSAVFLLLFGWAYFSPAPARSPITIAADRRMTFKMTHDKSLTRFAIDLDRGRARLDFLGNSNTQHSTLIDLINCTVLTVDWFGSGGQLCQTRPLAGNCSMPATFDATLTETREITDPQDRILEKITFHTAAATALDDPLSLIREEMSHVVHSFERRGQVFAVFDYAADFRPEWETVFRTCEFNDGRVPPTHDEQLAATTWALDTVDLKCSLTDEQLVRRLLNGQEMYGNWCRYNVPNAANGAGICGTESCADGGLDALCRLTHKRIARTFNSVPLPSCNATRTALLAADAYTTVCNQTSVYAASCQRMLPVMQAYWHCFPCEDLLAHDIAAMDEEFTGVFVPTVQTVWRHTTF